MKRGAAKRAGAALVGDQWHHFTLPHVTSRGQKRCGLRKAWRCRCGRFTFKKTALEHNCAAPRRNSQFLMRKCVETLKKHRQAALEMLTEKRPSIEAFSAAGVERWALYRNGRSVASRFCWGRS